MNLVLTGVNSIIQQNLDAIKKQIIMMKYLFGKTATNQLNHIPIMNFSSTISMCAFSLFTALSYIYPKRTE